MFKCLRQPIPISINIFDDMKIKSENKTNTEIPFTPLLCHTHNNKQPGDPSTLTSWESIIMQISNS